MTRPSWQRATRFALLLAMLVGVTGACGSSSGSTATTGTAERGADRRLDAALSSFVGRADGPPGIAVVVQRDANAPVMHSFGTAEVGAHRPIRIEDHLRIASVSKAFSGAAALAAVKAGGLALSSTIGSVLPSLPTEWHAVTLRELLQHTSGVPDFSKSKGFGPALTASLQTAPAPAELLKLASTELSFAPGSKYEYSNSDNVIVALMVEAVSGHSYAAELAATVTRPLGLAATTLTTGSAIPTPTVHGYDLDPPKAPEDVTNLFAAGWAFSSGGIVSTPKDTNRFIRAYARGEETDAPTRRAQFRFVSGGSEPTGPGENAAGLGIFRYRTRCGTVYGHTGNTSGYTQFIAASRDGARSTSVSINAKITPSTNEAAFSALRRIFELAVCASLR